MAIRCHDECAGKFGSRLGRLGAFIGYTGKSAWNSAKHYAGKTGVLRGRGSNTLVDRAGSFLDRKASTALRGSCCFVAGTVVWTASGQMPIEHVQLGHLVLSKHHETGEVGWYPVIDTIEIPASALLVLTLEHESGEIETVETTDEHPFRVGGSWARADTLVPGTTIETMHGTARVSALAYGSQRQTVYNITVQGAHTYLVGDDKVWVHNCGGGLHHVLPFYLRGIPRDGSRGQIPLSSQLHSELHVLINTIGARHGIPKMTGPGNGRAAVTRWAARIGPETAERKIRETLFEAYGRFDSKHGTSLWNELMSQLSDGPIRP